MLLKGGFLSETYGSIGWMPEYKLSGINKNTSYNGMKDSKSTSNSML